MLLGTAVILRELEPLFDIVMFDFPSNASVCSYRFYADDLFEAPADPSGPAFLCLTTPEQLAFLSHVPANCAVICCGCPERIENVFGCDLILTRRAGDLIPLANALGRIFDKYNTWEQRLAQCPVSVDGLNAMLQCSRDILRGAIILADYHFNYVANTADFSRNIEKIRQQYGEQTPPYIAEELLTNPDYFKVQNTKELFEYPIHDGDGTVPALCCNLFREGESEYRARLLFVSDAITFTDAQRSLLRVLGDRIGAVYNQLSDYSLPLSAYDGLREMILKAVRGQPSAASLIAPGLRAAGWEPQDEYRILLFQSAFLENVKEINAVARTQLELLLPGSCGVITDGCIVLVVNCTVLSRAMGGVPVKIREKLSDYQREHLYKAGVSLRFHGFGNLCFGYREASAALRLGNRRDNMFWFYDFEDYMMDYIIEKCSEEIPSSELIHPGIRKLVRYDRAEGTDLTGTLKTYMACGFNVTHAADALFMHRTTLLKHLKKIERVSGIRVSDTKAALHAALSFRFLESS